MNGLSELSFPQDYFCDEVREGFYVSETMKRYWAAQIVVLSEIDKICIRHDLNWYATDGTLLGAVRHKGYIPWDDDLDIAMLRTDYERFLEYAREELPKGYFILSSEDSEEYYYPFGRITNSDAIDMRKDFLVANHGCPFVAGVDIFPFDNVFSDIQKEKERRERGNKVFNTMRGLLGNSYSESEKNRKLREIEKENNIEFKEGDICRQLLLLFEEICVECKDNTSKEVELLYLSATEGKSILLREYFSAWESVPFETATVRATKYYDEMLRKLFGNYMKVEMGTADHQYPIYRRLEDLYREKTGKNPNRYAFRKEDFAPEIKKTFRQQFGEMFGRMHAIHDKLQALTDAQDDAYMVTLLQACQKAAVSIGNAIEAKFGEGTDIVACLEQYCEKVYETSCDWTDTSAKELDACLANAERLFTELIDTAKKDILFLPCRAGWWDSMKKIFRQLDTDDANSVSVIPLPYCFFDDYGNIGETLRDTKEFSDKPELKDRLTNFDEYDIEKRHPDVIIIQYPFDGYSGAMAIPDMLYSGMLSKYTDELIYVPFLDPLPPESDDDVIFKSLRDLVEQPAVFNSDMVLLDSERLRDCYIKYLVGMTGESFRDYWKNKINIAEGDCYEY